MTKFYFVVSQGLAGDPENSSGLLNVLVAYCAPSESEFVQSSTAARGLRREKQASAAPERTAQQAKGHGIGDAATGARNAPQAEPTDGPTNARAELADSVRPRSGPKKTGSEGRRHRAKRSLAIGLKIRGSSAGLQVQRLVKLRGALKSRAYVTQARYRSRRKAPRQGARKTREVNPR